jgi:tetratricopeptide (TPR) repeat protein
MAKSTGALYPTCLALLPGEEVRQGFIVECFKEGKGRLNFAHHLLMSQLIVNNFVRIVLTTNFDDILLRALQLYFEIPAIIDADSTHTLMTNSVFTQIAYLHGRLSSYRQRHTERELLQAMPEFESFMVSVLKDHGLVVVGYRGGDEAPMKILMRVLEKRRAGPGGGLFWVSFEREPEKLSVNAQRILKLKDTYWLGGWDADTFFEKLCAGPGIGLSLPDFLSDPKQFAKRIEGILPERARGPWSELQEPGPAPAIFEVEPIVLSSQEVRATDTSLEVSSLNAGTHTVMPERRTPEETIALYELSLGPEPNDRKGFVDLANALYLVNRYEEALEKYRRATELDPDSAEAFANWGQALQALGRDEEALEKYRRATEITPGYAWALAHWGHALQKLGRNDEALEKYRRATEINPDYAWAFVHWGQVLKKLDRDEEALEKYRRATEITPGYAFALANWGQTLQKLGRIEEALEKYRQATEINPDYAWALANSGQALQRLNRDEEALEKYRRATEINPKYAWAFAHWGHALQQLGRDEEALEKYRRATEINPDYAWALDRWGIALAILGHYEESLEKHRHASEIEPTNAWAKYHWGQVLQKLDRIEEAIVAYKRAIELEPKQGSFRCSLAGIYRKLGREAEYTEQIKIGSELFEEETEYNRACFESVCGNTDKAIALFNAALQKKFHWTLRTALIDPDLDFVREDPRFQTLVSEVRPTE